jgi:hypothetical protein
MEKWEGIIIDSTIPELLVDRDTLFFGETEWSVYVAVGMMWYYYATDAICSKYRIHDDRIAVQ